MYYMAFSSTYILFMLYFSVFRVWYPNQMIYIFVHIYIYYTLGFLWEGSEDSQDFAVSGGTVCSYLVPLDRASFSRIMGASCYNELYVLCPIQ